MKLSGWQRYRKAARKVREELDSGRQVSSVQNRSATSLSIIQISMLPVEPGMPQFVGENVSTPCDGQAFADIDGFSFIIPNPIRIRILPVHLGVCNLPDHDVVAERKDDFVWYSHHAPHGRIK